MFSRKGETGLRAVCVYGCVCVLAGVRTCMLLCVFSRVDRFENYECVHASVHTCMLLCMYSCMDLFGNYEYVHTHVPGGGGCVYLGTLIVCFLPFQFQSVLESVLSKLARYDEGTFFASILSLTVCVANKQHLTVFLSFVVVWCVFVCFVFMSSPNAQSGNEYHSGWGVFVA